MAATCGSRETAPAILSAVRSCSSRLVTWKARRGSMMVTSVPVSSAVRAASSAAARRSRRSGTSMTSSGTSAAAEASQRLRRCSACFESIIRCTARSSTGRSERA